MDGKRVAVGVYTMRQPDDQPQQTTDEGTVRNTLGESSHYGPTLEKRRECLKPVRSRWSKVRRGVSRTTRRWRFTYYLTFCVRLFSSGGTQ